MALIDAQHERCPFQTGGRCVQMPQIHGKPNMRSVFYRW